MSDEAPPAAEPPAPDAPIPDEAPPRAEPSPLTMRPNEIAADRALAERRPPQVSTGRRVLATIVAASPVGFLARGAGSFLVGDRGTAKRLALLGGVGLGLMVAGGVPAGVTGGNPYVLIPFVPMLVAGTGMFLQSWFADIDSASGADAVGAPRARVPWSLEAGLVWTHDAYRDRALARGAARATTGRLELGVTGYQATDDSYVGGDLAVGVRLLGAAADGAPIPDNSSLLVRGTARVRDDREDEVQVVTSELELVGRLDLRRIAHVLEGSYAELSTGGGLERAAFATASEKGGLLLGRFAYGRYLGKRGEAQVYYDHRRDSFAGGIAAYRAAGFVGSVGALVDLRLAGRWAARAELEIGSAWVTSIGLRYQGGPP